MIAHYQEHHREPIAGTEYRCVMQSCWDDSGYLRYDIVIDDEEYFVTQWDSEREPLGILVLLDPRVMMHERDPEVVSALAIYDTRPLWHESHLDLYHRMVSPDCPWRGWQMLERMESWLRLHTQYRVITAREVSKYHVIKRLIRNGFVGRDAHETERIEQIVNDSSTHRTTNHYGYDQDDTIVNEVGQELFFALVKML